MDKVRAKNIEKKLVGQRIGGWLIKRHINNGKSAVVFEGEKDGILAAVKVFDPELVERFGKSVQLERINRECSLIGSIHKNLVKIYDGGECKDTNNLFVSMEFIDAPNLGSVIDCVPREKISSIVQQIASAAKFLEEKKLAHRDIKPDNIAITPDFSRAVLLDLGVVRPFGQPGLTDEDARVFVGTLRYSSPEFLLRSEDDTIDGWRALTFYQLGAVLHDLIMRQPLFNDFSEPFALLVEAVKSEKPEVHANDIPPDIVLLAQNCLVKLPVSRLSLVNWNDFDSLSKIPKKSIGSAKERVRKRALQQRLELGDMNICQSLTITQINQRVTMHIDGIIRKECLGGACPRMEIIHEINGKIQVKVIFAASISHALPQKLCIQFDCEVVDNLILALNVFVSSCLMISNPINMNPLYSVRLFSGQLESDVLSDRIQSIIWSCFDLAQQQNFHPESDDILWLDLTKEVEI